MTHRTWLKRARREKLNMLVIWLAVLNLETPGEDGEPVKNWVRWGVRPEDMEELEAMLAAGQEIMALASDKGNRSKAINQKYADVFTKLEAFMRKFRMMYLHNPPLTNEELVMLGLLVKDEKPTRKNDPWVAIFIRTALGSNYGEVKIFVEAVSGSASDLDDRDNQGLYFIKTLILPAGSPAPTHHSQLTGEHKITRRRSGDKIVCGVEHSGDDLYLCARIEDGDRAGEYGPIIKVRIP